MAVGRISGQLLKSNLLRQGTNLAFETDLLYIDVVNNRIGVKTATPQYPLDVVGTARTTNLEATGQLDIGQITISGNSITTTAGQLNLSAPDGILYNNNLQVDDLIIAGNSISTTCVQKSLGIFNCAGAEPLIALDITRFNTSATLEGSLTSS